MSGVASKITSNPVFILVVVMFALIIVAGIPTMFDYSAQISAAVETTLEFLPLIALVGALAYLGGRAGK